MLKEIVNAVMPFWIKDTPNDLVSYVSMVTGESFQGKSADAIKAWLKARNLRFEINTYHKANPKPLIEIAILKPINGYRVHPAIDNSRWYGSGYTEQDALIRAISSMLAEKELEPVV